MLERNHKLSSPRSVLIHFHIFKNGGTSFDHALKREFRRGFVEFDGPGPRFVHLPEEIADYLQKHAQIRALSSHHLRFPLPEDSGMCLLAAFFMRHPLDRMHSIYRYERKQKSTSPGSLHAKGYNFPDYVRWRLDQGQANLLCNYHALVLTCNPRLGMKVPDPILAYKRLGELAVCGTVNRLEDSLAVAEQRLQSAFPGLNLATTPQNVTRRRRSSLQERLEEAEEACGAELFAEVAARNTLDLELYSLAEELLQRRIEAMSDGPGCIKSFHDRCKQLS